MHLTFGVASWYELPESILPNLHNLAGANNVGTKSREYVGPKPAELSQISVYSNHNSRYTSGGSQDHSHLGRGAPMFLGACGHGQLAANLLVSFRSYNYCMKMKEILTVGAGVGGGGVGGLKVGGACTGHAPKISII